MSNYAEQLAAVGAAADAEVFASGEAASRCATALDKARLDLEVRTQELAVAQARIAELEAQLPKPGVLFGAKPEPNTEAEWAASGVKAGAPYRIHNHYAQSWAEATRIVNDCTAEVCRVTCIDLNVDEAAIAAFRDDKDVLLGTLHEPEDNVEGGSITLAQWKAAQTKTRQTTDKLNATRKHKIRFGLCLMGPFTWNTRNPDDYFMPGVHEYLGTDPYAGMVNPKNPLAVTPEKMLGKQTAYAKAKGVPVLVCEWGAPDDGGDGRRAALIRAINQYARDHDFLGVLYWDHGGNTLDTVDEFKAAGGE